MINRHTIIYAEDDADDLFMVKQAFEKHDHIEIIHALNGLEALEVLDQMLSKDTKPCLVILDINMPKLDGRETLVKIKEDEKTRDIPVVMFTTSSSNSDRVFGEQWGAEVFTKPLHYKDLEAIALLFMNRCNFEINKLRASQ
jgi:DNA-binding response OmpR family regulator